MIPSLEMSLDIITLLRYITHIMLRDRGFCTHLKLETTAFALTNNCSIPLTLIGVKMKVLYFLQFYAMGP